MRKWLKRKGKQVFDKSRKLSKEAFLSVARILILENRIEKEVAQSFLGSLAAFTWSACIGALVKLLFFPPPSWVEGRVLAVASLGGVFGLFIALGSLQECNAWLIPEGEARSPYVLFLPSAVILILGATMVFAVPLAFISAFLFSYEIPVGLAVTDLSPNFIQLFYISYSLRLVFLIIQKTASLVMRQRRNLPIDVNKTRILKYFLLLTVTVVFLILSKQKAFQRLVFTFISSLLVWGFLCMAWWEKADKGDWGWRRAFLVSIVFLLLILSIIYASTYWL